MQSLKIQIGIGLGIVFLLGVSFIVFNFPAAENTINSQNQVDSETTIKTTPVAAPAPVTKPIPKPTPAPITTPIPTPAPTPIPAPIPTVNSYSLSEVALHNNPQDCWTAISGNVYNLTSFINGHPGGSRTIISLCGINGTNAFLNQHQGQRRPASELNNLFIGTLK